VLLDPNTLSAEHVRWRLSATRTARLAYATSASVGLADVHCATWTAARPARLIEWSKFSNASWRKDGSGFYYSRYDAPPPADYTGANYYQKLYFHRMGEPQASDLLVYERQTRRSGFNAT